ncbi:hypothetical protein ASPZODRAFT_1302790 [Penicilliopsis zonata CBS 506.65]|uniref:Uncharacterized protein n=1 Tax=Penicilliopsis zonata CBS 506.65 TaxID=1073090 RepID=A0A1L9S5V2_9EURO|nr:hypothetical protein ASPZODRAFT_1302790 [Penicilliopsis zonata CBS 506.65]OJJ42523.1 hypothetical protein ASPZODRAFT_1302790 [Penicilliopsis zonata CBS 506.65]
MVRRMNLDCWRRPIGKAEGAYGSTTRASPVDFCLRPNISHLPPTSASRHFQPSNHGHLLENLSRGSPSLRLAISCSR